MMRNIKLFGLLSALLAIIIVAGCSVVTGTFVISFWIENYDIHAESDFAYFSVDLSEEEDWNEHKDDIKNIDNVGFQLWLNNTGDETVTGEIYASTMLDTIYVDTAGIRNNATLIFSGLQIPPGKSYVDWPTSLLYIHNLSTLKNIVESGEFRGYALTTTLPFEVTLDSAAVIITLTAAP